MNLLQVSSFLLHLYRQIKNMQYDNKDHIDITVVRHTQQAFNVYQFLQLY